MALLSAGQLFQYAQQQAVNAVCLKTQSPAAAATYMAISTSAQSGVLQSTENTMAGATINEYATASGYARQAYGPTAATAASPSQAWNTSQLTWGPFTSAPGTANWGILCTLVSGTSANTIAVAPSALTRQSVTRFRLRPVLARPESGSSPRSDGRLPA
jgi:hypothetical protein